MSHIWSVTKCFCNIRSSIEIEDETQSKWNGYVLVHWIVYLRYIEMKLGIFDTNRLRRTKSKKYFKISKKQYHDDESYLIVDYYFRCCNIWNETEQHFLFLEISQMLYNYNKYTTKSKRKICHILASNITWITCWKIMNSNWRMN